MSDILKTFFPRQGKLTRYKDIIQNLATKVSNTINVPNLALPRYRLFVLSILNSFDPCYANSMKSAACIK